VIGPRRALLLAALGAAGGCTSIGPQRLDRDQLDYTRVVSESSKRQTLFNLVRLRFGDSPAFVSIGQLVSGYTVQSTAQANMQSNPSGPINSFWALLGNFQFTDRPTFTLNPMNGEQFVQAYLRPFSPADIIPLIQGGIPVDKLFRLVAQTVGELQNTHPLAGDRRSASAEFLPTLALLRILQENGALRIHLRRDRDGPRAFIGFDVQHAPHLRSMVDQVYRRLRVDPSAREVEIIYGPAREQQRGREIPILTRSLLSVLAAVAVEIEVPEADVAAGRTLPTLREPGAPRPMIIVRTGTDKPRLTYAEVRIDDRWYWVADNDFESKATFTILEILKSVAQSTRGLAQPVLTIPTS
jgi:hypothetical protein